MGGETITRRALSLTPLPSSLLIEMHPTALQVNIVAQQDRFSGKQDCGNDNSQRL